MSQTDIEQYELELMISYTMLYGLRNQLPNTWKIVQQLAEQHNVAD